MLFICAGTKSYMLDSEVGGSRLYTRRRTTSDAGLSPTPSPSGMEIDVVTQSFIPMPERPVEAVVMSLTYLVMLNAIVCGLEFCASAAFCYIPPMLLKAGIR